MNITDNISDDFSAKLYLTMVWILKKNWWDNYIVNADNGSISGIVLNPEQLPVAFAITGDDTVTSTRVDTAYGYFKLAYLPENTYTIIVEDLSDRNYRLESVSVKVKQDNNLGEITLE